MKTVKDIFMIVKFMELQVQCTELHCRRCRNKICCFMHAIADDMILRGEY